MATVLIRGMRGECDCATQREDGEELLQIKNTTLMLLILTLSVTIADYVEAMILPAIPLIQKQFNTTATLTSWTTTILLLVGTASVPLFGRLGDVHGKRKMFLAALGIYTAGVGIAVIAPSIYVLLFARGMQAIGLSLAPLALAVISDVFPKERQAHAQGLIGGSVAISTSAGYVLGSIVIQELGWRYGFFTVLIPSLAMLILSAKFLTDLIVPKRDEHVDYSGGATLGIGTMLVLVYLTEGSTTGWFSIENLLLLLLGLSLLVAFFKIEKRTLSPLIRFSLLKIRNVLVANSIRIFAGIFAFLFYYGFVYFAESPKPFGLGLDVLYTGLILAPATISAFLWAVIAGRVLPKIGPRPMIFLGSLLLIAGFALCIFSRSSMFSLVIDGVVYFAGLVTVLLPSINMISVSVPNEESGIAMSVNTMLSNLGQSFGPVIATTIMVSYSEPLTRLVNGKLAVIGSVPSPLAFNLIFAAGIVITCVIMLTNLFTQNYKFPAGAAKKT